MLKLDKVAQLSNYNKDIVLNKASLAIGKHLIAVFILILLSLVTLESNAEKISYQEYGALPDKSMFVISPSGTKIAYRTTSETNDFMMVVDIEKNKVLGGVDISAIKPKYAYFS